MKKWIIWFAILLLVINITAIVTILHTRKQEQTAEEITQQNLASDLSSLKYSGRWFRDELGLTGEQMRELQRFNPAFRQKVRNINFELTEKRMLMLDEMAAENTDTSILNSLSDSIGMLHSELKKATYLYYLEFKKMASPEQQVRLRQIFSQVFEGEIPAGHGKGMQPAGRMRRGQYRNQ
jgi:hypothetical protein